MSKSCKLALLLGASAMALAGPSVAQDVPVEEEASSDVIIVRGIKKSVADSIDVKRNATQLIDAISAEDIGKLPDENVAEALQRIPGVQITRTFGEGQEVSIRGLPQVRVSVDGRTILGYSIKVSPPENERLGRSSGLDIVPSGVFSRLEVIKSPQADQVEGGLGGVVNLVTPSPFDFVEPAIGFSLEGVYSDGSDKVEPAGSFFAARNFFNDRLGFLLAVDYSGRTSTIDANERNNFLNFSVGDTNGDGMTDIRPDRVRMERIITDRTRLGVSLEAQLQATDNIVLFAEGLFASLETNRQQPGFQYRWANAFTPTAYDGNAIVAGDVSGGQFLTLNTLRNQPTETRLFALGGDYEAGRIKFGAEASYSEGTVDTTIQSPILISRSFDASFDFRGGAVPSLVFSDPAAVADIGNYDFLRTSLNSSFGELDEAAVKADLEVSIDGGFFQAVKVGGRYRDLGNTFNAFSDRFTAFEVSEFGSGVTLVNNGLLEGTGASIPSDYPILPILPSSFYTNGAATPNRTRDYDLSEKATAVYAMVDFENSIGSIPYAGNLGARYVHTDFNVETFTRLSDGSLTPVVDQNDYGNFLPSANVAFDLDDELKLRFSAARVLQRASTADLAPSLFINEANFTATGGNAALEPTLANQLDASLEYYFAPAGLLSAAIFYKDVSDLVANETTEQVFEGFEALGPISSVRPGNVGSAEIVGFELVYQQAFEFLPAPFDGFGVIANYTYSDAEASDVNGDPQPVVGNSENSFNLIGYYEKGRFSTRLAYNYRDEAAFSFTQGRPDFVDAVGNLDFQLGYDLTDNVSLSFKAINLLPDDSAINEYSASNSILQNSYALGESRYFFGVRGRF
ncbi:TonB-dependent receptor [uncultured Algimonas sp.]|uniref:TonB-dependent receptor n=1 Tax=uncultured Algimonas sp. TaxID=1547920 RepID=UPI002620E6DF|nr:TonB-dependent receptor [uncultured Algimonas sp.]